MPGAPIAGSRRAAAISSPPGDAEAANLTLALAVADVGWFTTDHLFGAIERDDIATLRLECDDAVVAWQRAGPRRLWSSPIEQTSSRHWRRRLVLPPGWMKRFPRLGMSPIARTVSRWRKAVAPDAPLALVMTYPYYLSLRQRLNPARTVYFNVDEYALYWPERAAEVEALERSAVRGSDLTVCVARFRAEALRAAVPEASERVHHLPHGVPASMLAARAFDVPAPPPPDDPALAALPRPWLGYIGTMEDRLDWGLLDHLAARFETASVLLIGRAPSPGPEPWRETARRCLARPNVHALGWRPQDHLGPYVQALDVALIPYRTDHPFNIACSPTKIMDYLGGTRPIVSTDLPECRLHSRLIRVAEDGPAAFLADVAAILDAGSNDHLAQDRLDYARDHTCARQVARFLDLLASVGGK
jgi:hypothetical protein